jgi:uncharacterized protein YeaO (DUF488 family)
MPIRTRRWNDPVKADDGLRILVTRYRPRGLRKQRETWELWAKQLGPSEALHADAYGKHGPPISWDEYRTRYLQEMTAHKAQIADLAARVRRGETITLLCSNACTNPLHCHRTLLKELIEAELPPELHSPPEAPPSGIANPALKKLRDWLE